MLPAWAGERGRTVEYDVADSIHTAPGWRVIGKPFYTCITPADRSADHVVIRWIRSFAPEAIPIWRKQRYLPPNSNRPVIATHLCIARYLKDPHTARQLTYIEMPLNAKHPRPNQLEFVMEMRDETVMHKGGPGAPVPVDMRLYHYLRADDGMTKTGKQRADEASARARKAKAAQDAFERDEREYIRRDRDRFIQKQLDAPGDTVAAFRQWKIKRRLAAMRRRGIVSPRAFIQMKNQGVL